MRLYAPLVRVLHFKSDYSTSYTIQVELISAIAFQKITFSTLQRLDWSPILNHAGIVHLLSPSLKMVQIHEARVNSALLRTFTALAVDLFMGGLATNCPNLNALVMGQAFDLTPNAASAILALQHLQILVVPVMGERALDVIVPLATQRALVKLNVKINCQEINALEVMPIVFDGLQFMAIAGATTVVTQVLLTVSCPHLRNLHIDTSDHPTDVIGCPTLIQAVASCAGPGLTRLTATASFRQFTGNLSTLDPLWKFRRLELLDLRMGSFYPTDDQFIQTFLHWPSIQGVVLSKSKYPPFPPNQLPPISLTLKAILKVANLCPDLEHLCVPLDASAVPVEVVQSVARRRNGISLWPSSFSPIDDPQAVALYLNDYGHVVTVVPNSRGEFQEKWQKVTELLGVLNAARVRTKRLRADNGS